LKLMPSMPISTSKPGHIIILVILIFRITLSAASADGQKNVLFLMADDFNHWLNAIGYYPQSLTPNLDDLANRGVLFTEAHCSSPVCNPSRNAIWSGFRPSTTGIMDNSGGFVRDIEGFANIHTMHQYFMENGYYTFGAGKLWHQSAMGGYLTDSDHWSEISTQSTGSLGGNTYLWESPSDDLFKWGAGTFEFPENADDTKLAMDVARRISEYPASEHADKPFFIACGLFRPHLPWRCHKMFWDKFSPDTLNIPVGYLDNDLDDIPGASIQTKHNEVLADNKWKDGIWAYLANMNYADYNIGIILDSLEDSPLKDNTIICFMGDHGWHLGEKSRWGKYSLYDQANHTTLIIYDPSAAGNGKVCEKVVSLQDLYPTLVELAGLPEKTNIEGRSIAGLTERPDSASWDWPVLMSYKGTHFIKTNNWRFVDNGSSSQLYNLTNDPYEWNNLYSNTAYNEVVILLKAKMDSIFKIGEDIRDTLIAFVGIEEMESNVYLNGKLKLLAGNVINNNTLSLDLTYTNVLVKVQVVDMQGRTVLNRWVAGEQKISITMGDLEKGVYLLRVLDDDLKYTEKFLKI
jgi:arylsulfatase A-like enzyme